MTLDWRRRKHIEQRRLELLILVVAALLFGGCRLLHKVAVTQINGSAPRFTLYTPSSGWLHPESFGVEITQLFVLHRLRDESNRRYEQMWAISTKSETSVMLKEVVYGAVPPDFQEVVHARPLVAGERYEVVSSRPGNTGGGAFQAEKDWPPRDK